jgi:tRNA-intron endonuclease
MKGKGFLVEDKVIVTEKEFKDHLISKGFGERKGKELILDLYEALHLLEKEKLSLEDIKGKKVSEKQLIELGLKNNKNFYSAFQVFNDLTNKGYVVKTGFKFGFSFRVYPKGKKTGEAHTAFVVMLASQEKNLLMPQLSRAVRLAANLNTSLLIAVIDSENEISYYEVSRRVL